MKFVLTWVIVLLSNTVCSSPIPDPQPLNGESSLEELVYGNTADPYIDSTEKNDNINNNIVYPKSSMDIEESNAEIESSPSPNDLLEQETYYPFGGVWFGYRPWGGWWRPGWGAYRWGYWNRPGWGRPGWGSWGRPGWHGPGWNSQWGGRW